MHILRNDDDDEDEGDDDDDDDDNDDEDVDDDDEDEDVDDDDEDEEVKETCWSPKAISQMYNLKFLGIDGIFHDPQHLPNSLRVLCWRLYPSNSLPSTFQPDELVMLCLQKSRIEQLSIGIKVIVLLSILTTLHLNFNKSDTRKLINLTSFLTCFFFLS